MTPQKKYQFVSWFPEWVGFSFFRPIRALTLIYDWYLFLGFWEIRKWHDELRDLIKAIEQVDKRDDFIMEKDNGKYSCDVWDKTCHRVWSTGQSSLALAISLAIKKAGEAK